MESESSLTTKVENDEQGRNGVYEVCVIQRYSNRQELINHKQLTVHYEFLRGGRRSVSASRALSLSLFLFFFML